MQKRVTAIRCRLTDGKNKFLPQDVMSDKEKFKEKAAGNIFSECFPLLL